MNVHILLVEDNPHITKINRDTFEEAGYRVSCAETVAQAQVLFHAEVPDLIVLDIMLPDGNGLELCRKIRGESNVPILFLSARSANAQIVEGLRAGGDDYLAKPYDLEVLLAKTEVLLRRGRVQTDIRLGPLYLDVVACTAYQNGKDLLLTRKDFSLLLLLVKNEGKAVPKEQIFEEVWKRPLSGDTQALWAAVSRLKRKLELGGASFVVHSPHRGGYCLEYRRVPTDKILSKP